MISSLHVARQSATIDKFNRRWWFILSIMYATIFLELIANTRHNLLKIIGFGVGMGYHYNERRPVQVLLTLTIVILVVWLKFILNKFILIQSWTRRALMIGVSSVSLLILEIISLHQVDAVIYAKIGPIMVIGWLWLVLGFLASAIASAAVHPTSI